MTLKHDFFTSTISERPHCFFLIPKEKEAYICHRFEQTIAPLLLLKLGQKCFQLHRFLNTFLHLAALLFCDGFSFYPFGTFDLWAMPSPEPVSTTQHPESNSLPLLLPPPQLKFMTNEWISSSTSLQTYCKSITNRKHTNIFLQIPRFHSAGGYGLPSAALGSSSYNFEGSLGSRNQGFLGYPQNVSHFLLDSHGHWNQKLLFLFPGSHQTVSVC